LIVVDCSAVVDALTLVEGSDELMGYLQSQQLHAPPLIDYELVNALRGMVRGGVISEARARDAIEDFDELPLNRWPAGALLQLRALELRHNLTAYDASYVALAEVLHCPLITRDERLARATGHRAAIEVL
jgi:predicted nucleic acid-binding protein